MTTLDDLRAALRQWTGRPLFALLVTAMLGLSLGLATVAFSLFDAVLLRPLPYADSDRLVHVFAFNREAPRTVAGRLRRRIGCHRPGGPELVELGQLYDAGELAIVQNVGYPDQNRSHFTSSDIWSKAAWFDPTEPAEVLDGWVGRYFERYCDDVVSPMLGLRIGRRAALAFASASPRSVTIENPAIMEWTGYDTELRGLQYTTTASRWGAWVSAIPHWIYFTAIRQHQTVWIQFVIWSSGIGTVLAIIGLVVAVSRYSPGRRYRQDGRPVRLPYRGQQRWHAILGLIFGVATVTWAFSGMLSLDPFPSATPRGPAGGRPELAEALRGDVALDDFAALSPGDLLARHPDLEVKAIELTAFDGRPLYAARLGDGATVMFGIDGRRVDRFDHAAIARIVRRVAPDAGAVETRILDRYDRYYLDRRRARPLPVILAQLHDDAATRYYIDPATGRVVGQYSNRRWVSRWLYSGLHSLNFPWLYNNRPLWDIVVITFMLGGTALCVTSLVLSWRVLGRTLRQALPR